MKQYTIYNTDTGEITGYIKTSSDQTSADVQQNYPDAIPGYWDRDTYEIVNGQPVAKTPVDVTVDVAGLHRQLRNELLLAVDRINPTWYASLDSDQQQQLITYRQALLAVPQQSGFPETVNWPAKPTWL